MSRREIHRDRSDVARSCIVVKVACVTIAFAPAFTPLPGARPWGVQPPGTFCTEPAFSVALLCRGSKHAQFQFPALDQGGYRQAKEPGPEVSDSVGCRAAWSNRRSNRDKGSRTETLAKNEGPEDGR